LIYFDNAASTAPLGTLHNYYNPSSPHCLGIQSERALRSARNQISGIVSSLNRHSEPPQHLSATDGDIIFTSGGTESNNLAIMGHTLAHIRQPIVIYCSTHEHPSLVAPTRFAIARHWAREAPTLESLTGKSLLVISHVNHETGDINDIETIASTLKAANPEASVLVDGAQSFCKEMLSLNSIDFYSFSGHKCHGPLGVGGLWVRKGAKLIPLLHGGGQENELRSGTENVPGIVQMAEAAHSLAQGFEANHSHATRIKGIIMSIQEILPDVLINALTANTSPYILNMSFLGVKGEILVHALSEKDLCVSMGAACRSRKSGPSALELMGFASAVAESAIRFSFSYLNTLEEAYKAKELVIDQVRRFRKMKGF